MVDLVPLDHVFVGAVLDHVIRQADLLRIVDKGLTVVLKQVLLPGRLGLG